MRGVGILLLVGVSYGAAFDIAVYGSTPAGIAAAVMAAREGKRVALVEPSAHFGGMLTGGLSYTDFRTLESTSGFFREYMDRVLAYYERKYGKQSKQVEDCFHGALAEPQVSTLVLRGLIGEQKERLTLVMSSPLLAVDKRGKYIRSARFQHGVIEARAWIDATYEGDLMALAGVRYRTDREATTEYGERFAGVLFFDQGRILPGSSGERDDNVQCMNFRITMTNRPENRVAVPRPQGYRREEFLFLLPHIANGRIREIYTEDHSGILRLQRLPNEKSDMNDIKQAVARLSLPGENNAWPNGDAAARQRIYDRHVAYDFGLLYFLANDEAVPESIRAKAREWGLAKDEFVDNGHHPVALYVREARRMVGQYLFRQQDTETAPRSVRAPWHRDSIAIGDYALNSHGHQKAGPLYPNLVEGDFAYGTTPFQIPYGVMVPKEVDNLLVPVAVSATHVGFSALRLEPTWTALGHAAGVAAAMASGNQGNVKGVAVKKLQARLHEGGQATIYLTDVERSSHWFAAAQWAGTQGLFADLVDYREAVLTPLRKRFGLQYSYGFANHALEPERALEPALRAKWTRRLPCAGKVTASTRGEFLVGAQRACSL